MAEQEKLDKEVPDIADSDSENDNNNNYSSKHSVGLDGDGMKCQVCGISAEIRHFSGIACRACEAFFRSLKDYMDK
jgi:hypothetical protein